MTDNFSLIKVGVVSFTDPRETEFIPEREKYVKENHQELVSFLSGKGIKVVDTNSRLRKQGEIIFGISSHQEVNSCTNLLRQEDVECLILGLWHWTDPYLAVELCKWVDRPIMLFTKQNPAWGGTVLMSAVGASLWENAANRNLVLHERLISDKEALLPWIRGVAAGEKMKRSSLLLWGGSYCLKMEHLQDDVPRLKSFLINDILTEDQYILIRRAEEILQHHPQRIEQFTKWLKTHGTKIIFDSTMLTESTWKKEVALYLAARDRLRELEEENIIGVSIKCQPELSVEYGVTPCLIPSFFPFSEDDTGRKPIISTTCEGDIKGLLSCVLLTMLSPDIPALFGDIRDIRDDYILISNCGGSSVFYAQNSSQLVEVLPKVTIAAQCQGAGGGAVGYNGVAGEATVARFIRIKGRYYMQMGIGKFLPATEKLRQSLVFGQTWPLVLIALGTKQKNLIRATGSNHYCALVGNYAREIEYFCRASGIPIVRMDSDSDLERFVQELEYS